ncbi:MAG: hypothetical protein QM747_22095 [Nocardioides sp.]
MSPRSRAQGPLLAVTVALVLADSAVVTLALPDILVDLDTTVARVAWVLIAFNLVLGLVAVPAAIGFARVRPRVLGAGGAARVRRSLDRMRASPRRSTS